MVPGWADGEGGGASAPLPGSGCVGEGAAVISRQVFNAEITET